MRPEWVSAPLDGPGMTVSDPRELLLGHLDIARELIDGTTGE